MSRWVESLWYPPREGMARRVLLSPLWAASWAYRAGVAMRDVAYRRGWVEPVLVHGAAVISVGNLNVGGAGKTPAVIYLASLLRQRGFRVAVLSRGYGRQTTNDVVFSASDLPSHVEAGDEPLLIARRCPGVQVYVGQDRGRLAMRARADGAQVLLLDDGMQHRRLARTLEICALDAAAALGNGQLLPRGPLREPRSAIERADLLWIRGSVGALSDLAPRRPRVHVAFNPSSIVSPSDQRMPPAALNGTEVFALAGVARPQSFLRTLQALGAVVVGHHFAADHHAWTEGELEPLLHDARRRHLRIVTTEKDAVRLPRAFPAWALEMSTAVLSGEAELGAALDAALSSK